MPEKGKDDSDDQLGEEEKKWCAGDVQNPFVTGKIEVSEGQASKK
jgi:hypothetical protein